MSSATQQKSVREYVLTDKAELTALLNFLQKIRETDFQERLAAKLGGGRQYLEWVQKLVIQLNPDEDDKTPVLQQSVDATIHTVVEHADILCLLATLAKAIGLSYISNSGHPEAKRSAGNFVPSDTLVAVALNEKNGPTNAATEVTVDMWFIAQGQTPAKS